jgi:hypothetical protein
MGGGLEYTTRQDSFLANLLHHGEAMAERLLKQTRELVSIEKMTMAAAHEISRGSLQERLAAVFVWHQRETQALGDRKIALERALEETTRTVNGLASRREELQGELAAERTLATRSRAGLGSE